MINILNSGILVGRMAVKPKFYKNSNHSETALFYIDVPNTYKHGGKRSYGSFAVKAFINTPQIKKFYQKLNVGDAVIAHYHQEAYNKRNGEHAQQDSIDDLRTINSALDFGRYQKGAPSTASADSSNGNGAMDF